MRFRGIILLAALWACTGVDYASKVDTSIGAVDKRGSNCVIGPMLPYGSINPSPQTFKGGMDGYNPEQPIDGFAQLHVSGTGWSSYGHFLVQPQTGEPQLAPGTHASGHSSDITLPYLYATTLDRYGVRVEIAPSYYSAMYRFTYPESAGAGILLDASQSIARDIATEMGGTVLEAEASARGEDIRMKLRFRGGWPYGPYDLFLAGKVNKDYTARDWEEGGHKGTYLSFATRAGEQVLLKLAISFTSYEKAEELLRSEIPHWNFDKVAEAGRKAWNSKLSSIEAAFATPDEEKIFYSALYRVFTFARDRSRDNSKWATENPFWDDNYAYWDTFRTLYPLLVLVDQDAVRGNILGMLDRFEHNGLVSDGFIAGIERIPEQGGNDVDCVIADAFVKGVQGIDWEKAYRIVKFNADHRRQGQTDTSYRALGWIPESTMSSSKTLEYAYNDYCAYLMAQGLGHQEDAARYLDRSHRWTALWNPELEDGGYKGFFDARRLDGTFAGIDPRKYGGSWSTPFYEASAWTYNYFVPHDFDRMIELMGGPEAFVERLEFAFENKLAKYDNEPGFLASRAFVHAGRPDLSSKWIHHIIHNGFDTLGYPGNEDTGSMGSWYVFNVLGLCPNAGQDFYYLNAPAVSHAVITLAGGKKLTVKANAAPGNIYIASCRLNGKPVEGAVLRHSDLAGGGVLEFELTDTNIPELVRRANVVRTELPAPDDEGLYLGNGRFGAALSSLGLTRNPLSHLQYWGRFGFTSAIEKTATTADYLLPGLVLEWENAPAGVSGYRQEQDFYDGVLKTRFTTPEGKQLQITSWFDSVEKDLAGFEVELSEGEFPIVCYPKSDFQLYPFVFRDQVQQTLSASGKAGNWCLEISYPASLNAASAKFYVYSSAPVEADGEKVRFRLGKGRNKLYVRYGAPVEKTDLENSLERSMEGWHRKWEKSAWMDFPEKEMQQVYVRSLAYLLSSYDDTETGLIQPTNGLSGYPFPFHFVQDLEYVAPALMMTGHNDIVKSWVEKFAGEIPQMQAYAKHLWESSEGVYPPWELPFGEIEGYHQPTVPVAFCYEPHNVGYLCRLAREAGDFEPDKSWTDKYVKPLVEECCKFYLSACTKGEDGRWHLAWYPSIGQDEAGGRNKTDYLCSFYSAKYCFKTAVEMGLDADGRLAQILSDGFAFDSLLSSRGTWHTCHGADDFGIQKHPVQLDGLSYFPIEDAPLPTEAKAYELRHDITDRAREPYFFGWTLGQFLLTASNMKDAGGWLEDWSKMLPSGYTDPDWIQIRETSFNKGASFYVTTHGMILQSLIRNYVNDYWGCLEVGACPVSKGTVRFGNIRTRLGVTVSGEVGRNVANYKTDKSLFCPEGKLEGVSAQVFDDIRKRALERVSTPGLENQDSTLPWWYFCSEYLTDAAVVHAVDSTPQLDVWLHDVVMDLVGRPIADWNGPPFRGYNGGEMVGMLETAHLTWSVAICLDLAKDLFTPEEVEQIRYALREKGMIPCKRYIDRSPTYHNWNCVLHAGFTVAAAVLGDAAALKQSLEYLPVALDHFQDDGSYGESLQYANYAAYALTLTHETLLRSGMLSKPVQAAYFGLPKWAASAMMYRAQVSGWDKPALLPHSANFGDCTAFFRPSGDVLAHIAARAAGNEAGLATWVFNESYLPIGSVGVHDMASFGFIPDTGFLTVLLAPSMAGAMSPQQAGVPPTTAFSGGDAFLRDGWDSETVLAFKMPAEPRHAFAHLHGDVNSIILSWAGERFLADPGHACYRNITRPLDTSTASHNTCTFILPSGETLGQKPGVDRRLPWGDLVSMGGKRLLCEDHGEVSVLASDAADLYGAPIREFTRYAVLCGSQAVFVVDKVRSDVPVKTAWNWLFNNRDNLLDIGSSRQVITARRGDAVISLERDGNPARLSGPAYAILHDAYHPLPGQFCEGKPGSGISYRFTETEAAKESVTVHKITLGEGPCEWKISVDSSIEVTSPEGKSFSIPLS